MRIILAALALIVLALPASAQCWGYWGCDGRPVWQNPVYGHPWRYYADSGYYPYRYSPPVQMYRHVAPIRPVGPMHWGGHYAPHRGWSSYPRQGVMHGRWW